MAHNTPLPTQIPSHPLSRGEFYRYVLAFIVIILVLPSCKPNNLQTGDKLRYFDLKGFFEADTARLTKANPWVTKTVTHNGVTETKRVHIDNWGAELSLFIQSDINKPAWSQSYNVHSSATSIIYRAKTPDVKTRAIVINKKTDGSVKWIVIYNSSTNKLYQTKETLSYFPDSLYLIQKKQSVRLLGQNSYEIKGRLN